MRGCDGNGDGNNDDTNSDDDDCDDDDDDDDAAVAADGEDDERLHIWALKIGAPDQDFPPIFFFQKILAG